MGAAAGRNIHYDVDFAGVTVECRGADLADFANLAANDLEVTGNAELVVVGHSKAVEVGEGLVIGDRIGPALVTKSPAYAADSTAVLKSSNVVL